MPQALWDGAADSDLAGVLRAASDDASEGVQAAAQREARRAVEAVERTRNQAVQLNSSDLLGAIARRRRDAQSEASTVRDEEAPAAAAVALVRRLDSYLRNNTPPTTDRRARVCRRARRAPAFCSEAARAGDETGCWRRKRCCVTRCMFDHGVAPAEHGAKQIPWNSLMIMRLPYGNVGRRVPDPRADLDHQR